MTDKVQKIKDWISKEQDGLIDTNGNFEYPEHEGAYHILCSLDAYINSLQEEPVSKDLGEYINELSKQFPDVPFAKLSRIAVRVAKWQKERTIVDACEYLQDHIDKGLTIYHEQTWCKRDEFINRLKKAMEE